LSYNDAISNFALDAGYLQSGEGSLCQPVDLSPGAATNLGSLFNDPIDQEPGGDFPFYFGEHSEDFISWILKGDVTLIGTTLPLSHQSFDHELRPHGQDSTIITAGQDFQTTTVNPAFLTSTPFNQSSPSFIPDSFEQYLISLTPVSLPPSPQESRPPPKANPRKKRTYQPRH
jgi:hypothetical protein